MRAEPISAAIIPGGPGVNTYDIVVKRADAPATDVTVYMQLVDPQRDIRSAWHKTPSKSRTACTSAPATKSTKPAFGGRCWMWLRRTAQISRVAFAWQISEAAAVQQTRQPQLIHVVVLLGIAGVLAAWSAGRARRARWPRCS